MKRARMLLAAAAAMMLAARSDHLRIGRANMLGKPLKALRTPLAACLAAAFATWGRSSGRRRIATCSVPRSGATGSA